MLHTQELSIGYSPQMPLLPPLSLNLSAGKLTVLLGTNGAGKSSLLRTIAGLQPALAGKVFIEQLPLHSLKPHDLAQRLSLVLTHRPDDAYLTVEDTIALGRFPYMRWYQRRRDTDNQLITKALELTATTELRHKRLASLSDGQLQKVMIARALAQDTPILLLDEPTAHLDLPNRFMIFQLLCRLAIQTNKAILVATHDLEPALQTADKVWLLHQQHLHEGISETLALQGLIAQAFSHQDLVYEATLDKFLLATKFTHFVALEGQGMAYTQTEKALRRIGFGVQASALIQIHVQPAATGFLWHWAGKQSFSTLEKLLEALEAEK